ncbi:DUF3828 domain-containing protein [Paraburkholderia haematera]|jgi:hypothetical protein|uniref:DUF3828 domain-containing protein n=1 Tax=Paraburkholderia haematera TaxID=2793077 RepID=A0ABN7MU20_9BURK|nr:DUF3828 domain-containing protein [Paraburkholderia haematera]CAE6823501.1 hypothetical protein R69888_06221 [Paraburkholderia haematera]
MSKYLLLAYAALTLALGVIQPATASGPNTPEAVVRAFYTWYLEREGGPYQLTDNAIYRYVAKPTVDNLRDDYKHNRLPGGSDYFTRVQDLDENAWLNNMALHPTVALDGVAVIAVTFGAKEKKNLVVFVRQEQGLWKIIKVEDTNNYLGYHQYDVSD